MKARLRKIFRIIVVSILGLVFICFAIYVYLFYPRKAEPFELTAVNPTRNILIATQRSDFKEALVKSLCDSLKQSATHIKGIDVSQLATVDEKNWDSILIINSLVIKLHKNAARFISQSHTPEKIMVFVTSGGADWRPQSEFKVEAITAPSRKAHTHDLTRLIIDWIENRSDQHWTPDNLVLALIYSPQINVKEACGSIAGDLARYQALYPNLVVMINRIGYQYLRLGEIQSALEVFKLNVMVFPDSWNVYDSYGEALLKHGDRELAIDNYRKALALNPDSKATAEMLRKLDRK